jgi:glutathione-regulated potassium-efflux system ancillary protein KefF
VIVVIHAHPYPSRSRAGAALVAAIRDVPALEVRSLYELYPDYDIDVASEQAALERSRLIVWLHPAYWFTPPALMKHWFDAVLADGWSQAKGPSLSGKDCLWVTTLGDSEEAGGRLTPAVEQIARRCGMSWLDPFVVHGAHALRDEELRDQGRRLRARVDAWVARHAPKAI